MPTRTCVALLLSTLALAGCGVSTTSYVHTDTTLGRVVVYRNGVAYFERSARVDGDTLHLSVPADKVDDFLKSLTVFDAKTKQPAPISYPTNLPGASQGGLIDMAIRLPGKGPHDLKLTYVTDAPAWKPSYRIQLSQNNKVGLQAWAIIDNTSGENWEGVRLGVGASSALAFRFDLWSVRLVQRETLHSDDLFAQAPPTGGATHNARPTEKKVLADMSDVVLQNAQQQAAPPPPPVGTKANRVPTSGADKRKESANYPPSMPAGDYRAAPGAGMGAGRAMIDSHKDAKPREAMPSTTQESPNEFDALTRRIQAMKGQVVIEGYSDKNDSDKHASSLERANRAREQLIRNGVAPDKLVAVGKGEALGRAGGVRFVEAPPEENQQNKLAKVASENEPTSGEPIGTSHFESTGPMTVVRGSSAMVSILQTEAEGEVVYLYDAESVRGNAQFPFRSVRLRNPTDSALESGPVTVFGEGRFIGEGMCEPIPARSIAFVPFALDRQIVVERKDAERDEIARIISVQRGVFSSEIQHTKRTSLTLTNRLQEKTTVYIRHTVPQGYKLTKAPPSPEKIGDANLFRLEIEAGGRVEVVIEEATPIFRTTDIRSTDGMNMVKLYLNSAAEGPLKSAVSELIKVQQEIGNYEQQIATMREQMAEYKARMDELHVQLVSLRAVKNPQGNLMQHLEKKLQEVSEKMSKSTIDLVSIQEKLMVAKIRFQDGVADLSLEKKEKTEVSAEKK